MGYFGGFACYQLHLSKVMLLVKLLLKVLYCDFFLIPITHLPEGILLWRGLSKILSNLTYGAYLVLTLNRQTFWFIYLISSKCSQKSGTNPRLYFYLHMKFLIKTWLTLETNKWCNVELLIHKRKNVSICSTDWIWT